MKNKTQKIACHTFLLLSLFLNYSCSDELTERNDQFPQLNPNNIDELAGTWKPLLLTKPDEFSLDAPIATNSAAFTREINEIKSYQANLLLLTTKK